MIAIVVTWFALAVSVVTLPAQGPPHPSKPTAPIAATDGGRIAGWYESSPTGKVLVVWGPTGGYRLLDFDGVHFHRLEATGPDRYRTVGSGSWENASITVERDREGRSLALGLSVNGAPPTRMPRARESPFDMEEVRYRNGATELAGLLMIPRVRKLVGKTGGTLREVPLALPGAVFIQGSGDSDRDNVWAFTFAQHLARAGVVTLFPDKRGSGASGGDWRAASLEDLGDDALAAVSLLRGDRRVDPSRVGLVGLSQGGVVAPLAAVRSKDVAYVVAVSAGAVTLYDQMRHEMVQDLRREGVPADGISAIAAVGELATAYARTSTDSTWATYAAALAALKEGPWAPAAAELPGSRDDWHWSWWRKVGDVDPLWAWRRLERPALAVFGELDETDNVPMKESVRRLRDALEPEKNPRIAIRVFPGVGHTLADAKRGWVSREILSYLSEWVLDAVGGINPTVRSD